MKSLKNKGQINPKGCCKIVVIKEAKGLDKQISKSGCCSLDVFV